MNLKLFHKIFSAFMITILAAIVILVLIMHFMANRRFSDYVNKVEMEQLDDLVAALSSLHKEKQSWSQFKSDPGAWPRFIWFYLPETPGMPPPPPMPAPRRSKEPSEEDSSSRQPSVGPPERRHNEDFKEFKGNDHSRGRPRGPGFFPPDRESMIWRVALFDGSKKFLAGPPGFPELGYLLRPIRVEGSVQGWVGLRPLKQRSHPLETAFIGEQKRALWIAGFCVFALAGLISFLLSKHFLAPIKMLTRAAEEMSSLNFSTHLDVRTSDELGQLANTFNTMAQALEKNERLRKQWTSDVAHELRTPLAILRGEIEAMQDGIRTINAERLASLHDETNRMGKIVDDLHLLFEADSQKLVREMRPVKPLLILQEVMKTFETRLTQAGIQIEAHATENHSAVVNGDEDRLRQLFSNLIENTIRYTDSPGVLRINHYCSLKNLTLVFEDSPPGVPTEALDSLFDRLYRLDKSRSRALGGGGLGLAICKEIVNGHGGAIRASHSSLGGLQISIEFQLAPA